MVTKISNGVNFNLSGSGDNYGVENDYIYIVSANGNSFSTYAGNDVIDGSRATFNSFIIEMYGGLGNDHIHGTGGTDWVYDGLGNDVIALGNGDDRLFADGGNDVYYGGAGIDTVDFRYFNVLGATGGGETNTAGVKFDLGSSAVQDLGVFGFDQFFGFENVYGGAGGDKISGSAGANLIQGNEGNDVLDGRAGNDTLEGGMGIDYLIGGAGADTLNLAEFVAARDFVRFAAVTDSGLTNATMDVIQGFTKGTGATADRIDLALIDADASKAGNQAFLFKGTGAFNSPQGEVRYVISGGNTIVYVDTDADVAPEMAFLIKGVAGVSASDFLL